MHHGKRRIHRARRQATRLKPQRWRRQTRRTLKELRPRGFIGRPQTTLEQLPNHPIGKLALKLTTARPEHLQRQHLRTLNRLLEQRRFAHAGRTLNKRATAFSPLQRAQQIVQIRELPLTLNQIVPRLQKHPQP
jgi:hypothetical protein